MVRQTLPKERLKVAIPFMVLAVLLAGIVSLSWSVLRQQSTCLRAEEGYLYCSNIDNREPVLLQGEWEYYPNQVLFSSDFDWAGQAVDGSEPQYVQVPGPAPNAYGFGTYRLRFQAVTASDMFALKITDIWSSARVYLDGKLICTIGDPSTLSVASLPWNSSVYVSFSMDIFRRTHELIVQVSNYDYYMQGITSPIHFGTQIMVYNLSNAVRLIESVCVMSVLILAVLVLCLLLLRIQLGSILHLMLFSLCFGLNLLMSGEKLILNIFPSLNYILFTRAYLCTFLGMAVFMGMYVCEFGECGRLGLTLQRTSLSVSLLALAALFLVPQAGLATTFFLSLGLACLWVLMSLILMLRRLRRQETGCFFQVMAFFCWLYAYLTAVAYAQGMIGTSVRTGLLCAAVVSFVILQLVYVAQRVSYVYSGNERLAQRMLVSDKLKSELMAIVSHELRTPLHGIINITQSVIEDLLQSSGMPRTAQTDELNVSISLARRMSGIVGDLFDFVEQNYDGEVQLNPTNLRVEVNAVFEMFRYTCENTAIHFVNLIGTTGLTVYADESKLWQVLCNLVGNAVKYTRAGAVSVNARREGDMVTIAVSDTGIGMPADMLERVFEPYARIPAYDMNTPGSGLGLYIARKLVEEMGGSIAVTWSQPGQGTCISFTLRACDDKVFSDQHSVQKELTLPQVESEAAAFLRSVRPDSARVLVADDSPTNLKIISRIFADCNFTMDMAADGREAVDLAGKNAGKYDLVILDVMMPHMDGFEACRTIRRHCSPFDLPILMLTARDLTKDIVTGFWAGANDYVTKPVDSLELRARVFTLIKLKQSVAGAIENELSFLQAQIQPHFLYNAFNTISAIALTNGIAASELIDDLGVFLRSTFRGKKAADLVPLAREMEATQAYVNIQKARFGDKIHFTFRVDAPLDLTLPPLIIQPLVENAIRHGSLDRAGQVRILASAQVQGDELVISVEDDGPGFDAGSAKHPGHEGSGVGLTNINRRLKLYYGRQLDIRPVSPTGTRIVMRLPLDRLNRRGPREANVI